MACDHSQTVMSTVSIRNEIAKEIEEDVTKPTEIFLCSTVPVLADSSREGHSHWKMLQQGMKKGEDLLHKRKLKEHGFFQLKKEFKQFDLHKYPEIISTKLKEDIFKGSVWTRIN